MHTCWNVKKAESQKRLVEWWILCFFPFKETHKGSEVLLISRAHTSSVWWCSFYVLQLAHDSVFIFFWFSEKIFHVWFLFFCDGVNEPIWRCFKQLTENVFKDRAIALLTTGKRRFFRLISKGRKTEKSENTLFRQWLVIFSSRETTETIRSWACNPNATHVCERSLGAYYWLIFRFAFFLNIELFCDVVWKMFRFLFSLSRGPKIKNSEKLIEEIARERSLTQKSVRKNTEIKFLMMNLVSKQVFGVADRASERFFCRMENCYHMWAWSFADFMRDLFVFHRSNNSKIMKSQFFETFEAFWTFDSFLDHQWFFETAMVLTLTLLNFSFNILNQNQEKFHSTSNFIYDISLFMPPRSVSVCSSFETSTNSQKMISMKRTSSRSWCIPSMWLGFKDSVVLRSWHTKSVLRLPRSKTFGDAQAINYSSNILHLLNYSLSHKLSASPWHFLDKFLSSRFFKRVKKWKHENFHLIWPCRLAGKYLGKRGARTCNINEPASL